MSDAIISFPILGENFAINPKNTFELFGLEIHLYAVMIAIGLILAYFYMAYRSKDFGYTSDDTIDMLLWAVPLGFVGARLYYVVFYFSQFKADTFMETLKNIVSIWNGGIAIYGGVIFGVLGLFIYSRRKKRSLWGILDLASFGVIIGQILGRWGNFFNREAYGAMTNAPWRMGLTTEAGTVFVHPTFLYESLWNLIGLIIMHIVSKKKNRYEGKVALLYLCWYGLGRYFIEGLRTDSLYLFGTGIRVSQLLAAVLFGISAVLLVRNALRGKPCYESGAEELCEVDEEDITVEIIEEPVSSEEVTESVEEDDDDITVEIVEIEEEPKEEQIEEPAPEPVVSEPEKPSGFTDEEGYEYF